MKATEQYFPVVLFIMLCKVILTFESVDESVFSFPWKFFEHFGCLFRFLKATINYIYTLVISRVLDTPHIYTGKRE